MFGFEPSDFRDRWISVAPLLLTDAQIAAVIAEAEDVLLTEFPTLEQRVAAGKVRAETVKRILNAMVSRKVQNPDGLRTVQDSAGPFAGSITYSGDRTGVVELTAKEREDLTPKSPLKGKARTVDLTPRHSPFWRPS